MTNSRLLELYEKRRKGKVRNLKGIDPLQVAISNLINAERLKQGLSQAELGQRMGCSQVHISRLEDPNQGMLLNQMGEMGEM